VRRSKGKRFRVIPLNDLVLQALREHPRHITSQTVFHNPDGSYWKDVRGGFNATLTKAGLPRIRIHDMRHSFVSNLVMAGEDLRTVQELAGHRSITTTMNYAHLAPGRLKNSVAKLKWKGIVVSNPSVVLK
jgi:site-specific recombinase XerD